MKVLKNDVYPSLNFDAVVVNNNNSLNFLKSIPDKSLSLVITDANPDKDKNIDLESYLSSFKEIIDECYRALKDDGNICWILDDYQEGEEVFPLDIFFYDMFKTMGFKLRNRIVWHYKNVKVQKGYKTVLWFSKTDSYTFNLDSVRVPSKYPGKRKSSGPNKGKPSGNPLGKNPSDIWDLDFSKFDEVLWNLDNIDNEETIRIIKRNNYYPSELINRLVKALSNQGDIVLDMFSDLGTTQLIALHNKRKTIGIVKENESINTIFDRMKNVNKVFRAETEKVQG